MTPRARVLVIALAIFFVLGTGAAFLAVRNMLSGHSFAVLHKTACEFLTPDDARKLLGDKTKKSEENSKPPKETQDLNITQCSYTTKGKSVQDTRTIGLEVHAAKTEVGALTNVSHFPPHQTDEQQVPGYGDDALWDPVAGNLSILKDGNFYQVSASKSLGAGTVKLAEAQAVADIIGLKD